MKKAANIMKRFLTTGLAAVLLAGSLPAAVYAQETEDPEITIFIDEEEEGSDLSLVEDLEGSEEAGEEPVPVEDQDEPEEVDEDALGAYEDQLPEENADPESADTYTYTDMYSRLIPYGSDNADQLLKKQVTFGGKKWYIIEDNCDGEFHGTLTLLAAESECTEKMRFFNNNHVPKYSESDIKKTVDAMTGPGGVLAGVASAIKTVTVETKGDGTDEIYDTAENVKCYLLDIDTVNNKVPMNIRILSDNWWLRSPGYLRNGWATSASAVIGENAVLDKDKGAIGGNFGVEQNEFYVRPALQLDLEKVVFSSDNNKFELRAYAGILNTTTTVKFNGLDWYLIGLAPTGRNEGTITLLTKECIGVSPFNENGSTAYEGSTVKKYLDEYYDKNFSDVDSQVVEGEYGKLFLLSEDEMDAVFSANKNILKCGTVVGMHIDGLDSYDAGNYCWWLRDPSDVYPEMVQTMACTDWMFNDVTPNDKNIAGVRPAIVLNMRSVIYSSDEREIKRDANIGSVILSGGANATTSGGSTRQIGLTGDMETVTYTPDFGYTFDEFDDITKDGITVKRINARTVTVSGAPTGNAKIAVPDAVKTEGLYSGFTATAGTKNTDYENLVDDDLVKKWCKGDLPVESGSISMFIEFHSDEAFVPKSYILTTGDDTERYTARNPRNWKLMGKLNESDEWTILDDVKLDTRLPRKNFVAVSYSLEDNCNAFRYFRFEISKPNEGEKCMQLSELQFVGEAAYKVTASTDGNGTAKASPASGGKNATVTLTAKPSSGYTFDKWTVVKGKADLADKTKASTTLKLGTSDVEVKAVFKKEAAKVYKIKLTKEGKGMALASALSGTTGTRVNIVAGPDNGYTFKCWTVVKGKVTLMSNTAASTSFEIKSSDVEIKAVFTKTPEKKTDIGRATVALNKYTFTYNKKDQLPKVLSVRINKTNLTLNKDYSVSMPKSSKKVGTYTVTVKGMGKYTGSKSVTYKIEKAKNPVKISRKKDTLKVSSSDLKKKDQTISRKKYAMVKNDQGKVTYKLTKDHSKISIDKKTGQLRIEKGLKKGEYKIWVKVMDAGNDNYKPASETVKLTVKVK